ncbi:MAG: FAD-binding oxidoreductase [Actinomycetota bacterium]
MSLLQLRGLDGQTQGIPAGSLESFTGRLQGDVGYPGDGVYEEATTIWNGMVRRRPALVIRPHNMDGVVDTVGLARDHGVELSIRGGGHNIAGLALSDGGMTLDMSAFRDVSVDVPGRRVRVGAGCTLGEVDRATEEHGLATTLGFVSETGVAGLTLGGGFGYLTRRFGWTVDDLEEVEIVTAGGEVLRSSRTQNQELFWALRGGGGNFGVVTEFTFRLHEVGPDITGGLIAWSAEEAEGVLERYREITDSASRDLTLAVLMRNAPPAPWLPEDKHGRPMIAVVANHVGSAEGAEADLADLRRYGRPWADILQRKPYSAQQSMLDATQPKGMQYYWKSEFLTDLPDELLETYRAQFEGMDAPANQIVLFHLQGALEELAEDDGAVGNRDARHACAIQSMFPPGSPDAEANREWVRSAWQSLRPFSTGGNYINFQTDDEAADRIAGSYRKNLDRLSRVKAEYDPDNLFRVNRNIRPAR